MYAERVLPESEQWRYSADHLARYLFATPYASGRRVLDAGTGFGYGAAILKAKGATSVQAVDIDAQVIDQAMQSFGARGITFLVDDCERLSRVDGPVDLICNFENIEHLRDPGAFLRSAARLLTPDGMLLCSTPDRAGTEPFVEGRPANRFHVNEWYRDEFSALLMESFGEVDIRTQVRSNALLVREEGVRALESHLQYLWNNPLRRVVRACGRLLGFRQKWPSITGLRAPGIDDYPVVESGVAELIGAPWCHFAICTAPKRAAIVGADGSRDRANLPSGGR